MLDDAEEEGRGKRNQKGLKGKDTYAGFLRLPRFPIASVVELPQPSSHSLQLVMAGLCPPWGGGPGQESKSEQTAQYVFILCWFWWWLALPLSHMQAAAPSSHSPHLHAMGSYFSADGTQGTWSCRLP